MRCGISSNRSCHIHNFDGRVDGRASLTARALPGFSLYFSGIPWQVLPQELNCGSGMTCWRRLRDWQQAGIWDLMHFAMLDWLAHYDQIDWSRAVVDSCSVRAVYGGDQTGPNPTDRAKRGSKRHVICDGRGVPLAVRLTGANRNDSKEALALVDAIPPLQGERGRPRRPDCVLGDPATTPRRFGAVSGRGTSCPGWRCAAPSTAVAWADIRVWARGPSGMFTPSTPASLSRRMESSVF